MRRNHTGCQILANGKRLDDYSYEITDDGYCMAWQQSDYGECPDDWGDDEMFLGEISTEGIRGVRFGRKNWDASDARRFLPWGVGHWSRWNHLLKQTDGSIGFPPDDWEDSEDGDEAEAYEMYAEWVSEYSHEWDVIPISYSPGYYDSGSISIGDHGEWDLTRYGWDFTDAPEGYMFVRSRENEVERLVLYAERGQPEDRVQHLIELWNYYLAGEVYCLKVVKLPDGWQEMDEIDIEDDAVELIEDWCGGYYGDEETKLAAVGSVNWHRNKSLKEAV